MGKRDRGKENFDVKTLLMLLIILYAYSHDNEETNDSGTSKDKYDGWGGKKYYKPEPLTEENELDEKDYGKFKDDYEEGISDYAAPSENKPLKNKSKEHIGTGGDCLKGSINNTDKILDIKKDSSLKENSEISDKDKVEDCGIVSSEVIPEYPNKLIIQEGSCNYFAIYVPVVLSQFELEFDCETTIELDCPAVDIKRSKKKVCLEECILIPKINKLFLRGVVRKNIEYGAENNIRHITIEAPFKCTTEVQYYTAPVIAPGAEQLEIETLRADGMGTDLSEKTFINSENFNEKIYCILVSDEISELLTADEYKEKFETPEGERLFHSLTEKMVVKLNLKLLQKQQININKDMLK